MKTVKMIFTPIRVVIELVMNILTVLTIVIIAGLMLAYETLFN